MVRVALLQLRLQKNQNEAIEHAVKLLRNAAAAGANIVCLPELWYPKPINNFEQEFVQLIEAAKEQGMTVIPGAFLEKINDMLHISCPVIGKDGKMLGRQLKIHPYGDERKTVKSGSKAEIFDNGDFKFGIAICHDVVFPEVPRALARKGAEMLLFPSRIRNEGIEPWHMYVQVRALENRIPAAAPNACSRAYGGKSIAVDFTYDKKSNIALPKQALASVNEQILVMDIDLEQAKVIREKRFADFKSDVYASL